MTTAPPAARRRPAFAASLAVVLALVAGSAVAAPPPEADALDRFMETSGLNHEARAALQAVSALAPAEAASAAIAAPRLIADRLGEQASDMVVTALNFVGVKYRRGGTSAESGFDCSGFTRRVFEISRGLVLPRRADEQARAPGLVAIRAEDLRPGDLVFFNTLRRTFSHVGIYVGDGKFIHSPRTGGEVRVEDMGFAYWKKRFTGARRAETADAAVPPVSTLATPVATELSAAPTPR